MKKTLIFILIPVITLFWGCRKPTIKYNLANNYISSGILYCGKDKTAILEGKLNNTSSRIHIVNKNGKTINRYNLKHRYTWNGIPNNNYVYLYRVDKKNEGLIFNVLTGKIIYKVKGANVIFTEPDGKALFMLLDDQYILYDLNTNKNIWKIEKSKLAHLIGKMWVTNYPVNNQDNNFVLSHFKIDNDQKLYIMMGNENKIKLTTIDKKCKIETSTLFSSENNIFSYNFNDDFSKVCFLSEKNGYIFVNIAEVETWKVLYSKSYIKGTYSELKSFQNSFIIYYSKTCKGYVLSNYLGHYYFITDNGKLKYFPFGTNELAPSLNSQDIAFMILYDKKIIFRKENIDTITYMR